MKKIYYLYHKYPKNEKYYSCKAIGFFVSRIETQKLIDEYKLLQGFNNFKNNFFVEEFFLDDSLEFSLDTSSDYYYYIYNVYLISKSNCEDYILVGCFSSYNKAVSFLDSFCSQTHSIDDAWDIEIHKERIGLAAWSEGFCEDNQ